MVLKFFIHFLVELWIIMGPRGLMVINGVGVSGSFEGDCVTLFRVDTHYGIVHLHYSLVFCYVSGWFFTTCCRENIGRWIYCPLIYVFDCVGSGFPVRLHLVFCSYIRLLHAHFVLVCHYRGRSMHNTERDCSRWVFCARDTLEVGGFFLLLAVANQLMQVIFVTDSSILCVP